MAVRSSWPVISMTGQHRSPRFSPQRGCWDRGEEPRSWSWKFAFERQHFKGKTLARLPEIEVRKYTLQILLVCAWEPRTTNTVDMLHIPHSFFYRLFFSADLQLYTYVASPRWLLWMNANLKVVGFFCDHQTNPAPCSLLFQARLTRNSVTTRSFTCLEDEPIPFPLLADWKGKKISARGKACVFAQWSWRSVKFSKCL